MWGAICRVIGDACDKGLLGLGAPGGGETAVKTKVAELLREEL